MGLVGVADHVYGFASKSGLKKTVAQVGIEGPWPIEIRCTANGHFHLTGLVRGQQLLGQFCSQASFVTSRGIGQIFPQRFAVSRAIHIQVVAIDQASGAAGQPAKQPLDHGRKEARPIGVRWHGAEIDHLGLGAKLAHLGRIVEICRRRGDIGR